MKYFKSIEEMRAASADELAKVPGIPMNVAEDIYTFFKNKSV